MKSVISRTSNSGSLLDLGAGTERVSRLPSADLTLKGAEYSEENIRGSGNIYRDCTDGIILGIKGGSH